MLCFKLVARTHPVKGNKINLPPKVLSVLVDNKIPCPYTFELNTSTVACVEQFTSPNGVVQMSCQTMYNLKVQPDETVLCTFKPLPKGTLIVLKPEPMNFCEIEGFKCVLEVKLRHYPTLCQGESFEFEFAKEKYQFTVTNCSPAAQIYTAEADLNLEFELGKKDLHLSSSKFLSNVPSKDCNGNGLFDGEEAQNEFQIETWKQSVSRQKKEYFKKLNKRGCRGYRLG